MKNALIIMLARFSARIIKFFSLGSASTWPGHIALKLNKHFIKETLHQSPVKIILIAGTNGKTTTSTLLSYILAKNNYRVFQNEEGANLLNGIASAIIRNSNIGGAINYDYALFEVDENVLPLVLHQITPNAIILLNLFRDQLDRYGEVNTIAYKWSQALSKLSATPIIINGDDPQLYFIGKQLKTPVFYFGLSEAMMQKKAIPHDVDSVYCPQCQTKLTYKKMSYSHLGDYYCSNCQFKRANIVHYPINDYQVSLKGIYNYYNISSVLLLNDQVLHFAVKDLLPQLATFQPAFGRQEKIQYQGKNILLILSKNPTGFNQSIDMVKNINKKNLNVMVLLNDRIPDGTDVSWIWDVEFQELLPIAKHIFISGDRQFDMALRFKYCFSNDENITVQSDAYSFAQVTVIEDLKKAVHQAVSDTAENDQLVILATYSAMLETRQILVHKKLL